MRLIRTLFLYIYIQFISLWQKQSDFSSRQTTEQSLCFLNQCTITCYTHCCSLIHVVYIRWNYIIPNYTQSKKQLKIKPRKLLKTCTKSNNENAQNNISYMATHHLTHSAVSQKQHNSETSYSGRIHMWFHTTKLVYVCYYCLTTDTRRIMLSGS